jgi:hypothetical protein
MNLTWCMIALAVAGADDQEFGTPPHVSVVALAAAEAKVKAVENPELWPMNLATATHIAFDNSEGFRVIEFGFCGLNGYFGLHLDGPLTIARINADVPFARVKANAMALVRSVERAYGNLVQVQAALESAEQAACMAREAYSKVAGELTLAHCDPGVAELAEAAPRLEQFFVDVEKRKSEVQVAEQTLRKVLGLPPADNRRIVATTKPIEELISFEWDTCVEQTWQEHPENVEQQAIGRLAELCLFLAREQVIPLMDSDTQRQLKLLGPLLDSTVAVPLGQFLLALRPQISASSFVEGIDPGGDVYMDSLTWHRYLTNWAPMGTGRSPLANTRQAQYILLYTRARQRHVFKQTADSLSRHFVEVDETFHQFTVARRLQAAAVHRLAVQRVSYDEGRITLDRWLDAIDKNGQAMAAEARHQATYNNALAALSEARGTLLADRKITIAEGPKRIRPIAAKTTEPLSIGLGCFLQRDAAITGATNIVPWRCGSLLEAGSSVPPGRPRLPFEGGLEAPHGGLTALCAGLQTPHGNLTEGLHPSE